VQVRLRERKRAREAEGTGDIRGFFAGAGARPANKK
jgi:hypothetical protein